MLKRAAASYTKPGPPGGFVISTLILTPTGAAFVQDLTPGDLVLTRDHGAQPLRALHRTLSPSRAVTIAPEAIAPGLPWRHLRLAPTQRIALSGWKATMLFGVDDALIPVGALVSDGTILARTAIGATVTFEIVFDQPQVIYAEGIEVEVAARAHATLHLADSAAFVAPALPR